MAFQLSRLKRAVKCHLKGLNEALSLLDRGARVEPSGCRPHDANWEIGLIVIRKRADMQVALVAGWTPPLQVVVNYHHLLKFRPSTQKEWGHNDFK